MANPTTNYGFVLPTPTDLVTDLPADFDVALQGVDTRLKALQPGTTLGDLAYSSATANTNTRLGIGTSGQVLGISGGVPAWTSLSGFAPNLIINGAFIVNQRGYVSAANLASGDYGFDRWKSNYTNTTLTFTAGVNATTVTISSAGGIQQIIEQQNVPAGTYTLSWSGTATGRVYNSGGTPPSYAASPVTFTADGLANVVVEFTASGGTRTCGTVKFERSSLASTYSLAGGTFEGELAMCQRYYYRSSNDINKGFILGVAGGTNQIETIFRFPVTMRVSPTALDNSNIGVYQYSNATDYSGGTTTMVQNTVNSVALLYTHTSSVFTTGNTSVIKAAGGTGYLGFSAEL